MCNRNVNCISCDKDVVMRKEMDPSLLPQPYALPPTRSMGPYLAYELDALRKQQKSLPNSRNLNHFETALQQKSPRPGEDHICNRYCGGSHTITTPQQRVTRLGHFLNQWGPEAQGVPDGKLKDKDQDKLMVLGHAETITPRGSKSESDRRETAAKEQVRKASASQTQEKRASDTPSGDKRLSKVSAQRTSLPSPKASADLGDKRRISSAQKMSGSKRSSQSSAKSTEAIQAEAKSGSPITESKIPEETPSEVEKAEAGPPSSAVSGAPTMTPRTSQVGAQQSGQMSTKPSVQMAPRQSGQLSAKPSMSPSVKQSKLSGVTSARISTVAATVEEPPTEGSPAPAEQAPAAEAPPPEE